MNNTDTAALLARELMKLGDLPNSACHRVQFMCGKYPGGERPNGGMCETALVDFFARILNESGHNG